MTILGTAIVMFFVHFELEELNIIRRSHQGDTKSGQKFLKFFKLFQFSVFIKLINFMLRFFLFFYSVEKDHLDHHEHKEEKRKHLTLQAEGDHFTIDGKKFSIYSGEIHYFRVHPDYWEQRLSQLTAAGLNTVSTYIPWNFHEEIQGEYDFSEWRDLRRFIKTAEKVGLHVMLRVGPYICAEWEWGRVT